MKNNIAKKTKNIYNNNYYCIALYSLDKGISRFYYRIFLFDLKIFCKTLKIILQLLYNSKGEKNVKRREY